MSDSGLLLNATDLRRECDPAALGTGKRSTVGAAKKPS